MDERIRAASPGFWRWVREWLFWPFFQVKEHLFWEAIVTAGSAVAGGVLAAVAEQPFLTALGSGLVVGFGAMVAMFVVGLIVAPQRMQRDRLEQIARAAQREYESRDQQIMTMQNRISELEIAVDASKPHIRLRIDALWVGVAPDGRTALTVIANVANTGAPSILERFRFTVVTDQAAGIGEQHGPTHHPEGTLLYQGSPQSFIITPQLDETIEQPLAIRPSSMLYEKTSTPIPTGGMVRGALVFMFSKGFTVTAGNSLCLECYDVNGQYCGVMQSLPNLPSEPGYFPGL